MKAITLCADDYGFSPNICEGILKLIELQRITATTCMTSLPYWQRYAKPLLSYQQQIDIGLHFNLTDGIPLGPAPSLTDHSGRFLSIKNLAIRSFLRTIKPLDVENELNRQLDKFNEQIGHEPDFIDGHVHVHHYPVIRDALLKVYENRLRSHNCYIRISGHKYRLGFKKFIITATGALTLKSELENRQISHNTSFSGIYNFNTSPQYKNIFGKFLTEIENEGLIMCHPGLPERTSNNLPDPIRPTRFYEFQFLSSDDFLEECQKHQTKLVRLWKKKEDQNQVSPGNFSVPIHVEE